MAALFIDWFAASLVVLLVGRSTDPWTPGSLGQLWPLVTWLVLVSLATGLTPVSDYYFNVLVEDTQGNKALYSLTGVLGQTSSFDLTDSDGDGIPDDVDGDGVFGYADAADDAYATTTTDAATGYYIFDDLPEGSYIVGVDPVNFQTGGALYQTASSADLCPSVLAFVTGLDRDHDISLFVSFVDVPVGLDHLFKRIDFINYRF